MNIAIFGKGRLGSAVAAMLRDEADMPLVWMADKGDAPGQDADVVLDASCAEAIAEHLAWAIANHTNLVIGATGWDPAIIDRSAIEKAGIAVLTAPNFSIAVAFMRRAALALGRLAASDPAADLAIVDRHHRAKADAPSGTAKLLAAALAEGSGRHQGWTLGSAAAGCISIASLRSGTTVGYHEIRCETPMETISIVHDAHDRRIFARGAIMALRWLHGRHGVFTFDDMAADTIDPLFAPGGQQSSGRA
jgi:4-hydroxy-tetrahydrodipicolinate reductase